jgi:hypothetical protein
MRQTCFINDAPASFVINLTGFGQFNLARRPGNSLRPINFSSSFILRDSVEFGMPRA